MRRSTGVIPLAARGLTAALMTACLVSFPLVPDAEARTTVYVQFAWGGVFCGGLAFFVVVGQSYGLGAAPGGTEPALVTYRDGRLDAGWPLPAFTPRGAGTAEEGEGPGGRWEVDLFRWRF